jgi:Replication-relaxation
MSSLIWGFFIFQGGLKMKRKKFIFGENRKGVYLDSNDIKILELILTQRIVSTMQVHIYSFALTGMQLDTVQKKLKRWSKYKVVKQYRYTLGQVGLGFNYYTIGSNGVDILIAEGILTEEQRNQFKSRRTFTNLDHTLATQEVAIRCLAQFVHEDRFNVKSINPYVKPYILNSEEIKLIPDWIIKRENVYLNIELDTGSETTSEIKYKIERYIQLATDNPLNRYYVLISVIDDSITTKKDYSDNRSKRVSSLKYSIANVKGVEIENLEVYVCQLSRSYLTAFELIVGNYPQNSGVLIENYIDAMRNYYNNKILIQKAPNSTNDLVHTYYTYKQVHIGSDIELEDYKTFRIVAMEEGNVRSHKHLIEADNSEESIQVIGIYNSEYQVKYDVFGRIIPGLVLTSLREWEQGKYYYFQQKSPFILNKIDITPKK